MDDVATRLAALESEVHRLSTVIARLTPPAPHVDDATWLSAIADAIGDRVFSARDLVVHAQVDPALAAVLGDTSPRRIGKRLRRLAGQVVGPYRVVAVKRDRVGQLWCVQVRDLHAD